MIQLHENFSKNQVIDKDDIQEKVERHLEDVFGTQFADLKGGELPSINELIEHSWSKMTFNYGTGTKGRAYQEEEDAFLVAMMYCHGYGAAERIRMAIRRAWQFRFDWYFKSRSRCVLYYHNCRPLLSSFKTLNFFTLTFLPFS